MRRGLLRLVALLLLAPSPDAAAEPQPIPGTRVRLEVPPGFSLAPELPGIGREEDLTSVVVTELPLPLERVTADFSAESLAERGLELLRRGEVRVGPHRATLLHATQRAGGLVFRKWLLLLGDETGSVLLTATTPLDLEARHRDALVLVLRTAAWNAAAPRAPDTGLRFRVREVPPFEIATTADNAVVLGDPGHDGTGIPPLIAVGSSLGRVHLGDLERFARERLEQTPTLEAIRVREARDTRLAGRPAWELVAEARDSASGRAVIVHQIASGDGGHYFLLQGIVDAEDDVAAFARDFHAVAAGFEPLR